jgi:hypothetical protein
MTKINFMKKYNQEEAIKAYSHSINAEECLSFEYLNNIVVDYNELLKKEEKSKNDLTVLNCLRATIAVSLKPYACELAKQSLNNECLINHVKSTSRGDSFVNYAKEVYFPKLISFNYDYILTRITSGNVGEINDINDLLGNDYSMELYKFVINEYSAQQVAKLSKFGVDVSESNRVINSKTTYYIPQKSKVASTK